MSGLKIKRLINCVDLGWAEFAKCGQCQSWDLGSRAGPAEVLDPPPGLFSFSKMHYRTVKNNFLSSAQMVASEPSLGGCHKGHFSGSRQHSLSLWLCSSSKVVAWGEGGGT